MFWIFVLSFQKHIVLTVLIVFSIRDLYFGYMYRVSEKYIVL